MGKTEGTTLTDVDTSTERKRSGKRRHSVIDDAETVSGDSRIVKKNKKSRKREQEPEAMADDVGAEGESGNGKEKKRKQKRKNITRDEVHDTPKKKRRENKTGFTDPNEDEVLPDKPRKCLAYAFLQFHRPSKWKFNKACQNWLIRNFWSVNEVPEAYVLLVTAYFTNVQGGARETLIKLCNAALAAELPKNEVPSSELPTSNTSETLTVKSEPPLEADSRKRIRAQAVLDALAMSSVSPG